MKIMDFLLKNDGCLYENDELLIKNDGFYANKLMVL